VRRYSYRYPEGAMVIFGGHFDFEIRAAAALVVLADHLIPLTVSEIPTQIYWRFLSSLDPADILFVEFRLAENSYHLLDYRWTETAGAYRYLNMAPMSRVMVRALGLAGPRWIRKTNAVAGAARETPSNV